MMNATEYWDHLGDFNNTTWPVQIIWIICTIIVGITLFRKYSNWSNNVLKLLLSFAFAWNGIVFFILFSHGPIHHYFFSPLFILIALLFIVDVITKKTELRLPDRKWIRYITYIWILSWLLYPFVGIALGRTFPEVCTPMNPCPLTAFSIALMVASIPKVYKTLYIVLLPWALLGLPKCLGMYQCYEDCILFVAGVFGLVMIIINWKRI